MRKTVLSTDNRFSQKRLTGMDSVQFMQIVPSKRFKTSFESLPISLPVAYYHVAQEQLRIKSPKNINRVNPKENQASNTNNYKYFSQSRIKIMDKSSN